MKPRHCDRCALPLLVPRGISPLINRCIACGGAYHINTKSGHLRAALEIVAAVVVVCALLTMCSCVVVVKKNNDAHCSIPSAV